ncbi:MAG: penicillin-binding protein 2 [Chloroflexota bacterium]|nr:MAG: penicillin-binding protein 2 [Chloroflexota bacterium]
MSALTPAQFSRRTYVMFTIMVAVAMVIAGRLAYWQLLRHDDLNKLAGDLRERTITEYARRGDILTADGILLATDIYSYEVAAHPNLITNPKEQAQVLAPILGVSEAELVTKLSSKENTVMLTLSAPASAGRELTALRNAGKIGAIDFVAKPNRRYPGGSLAAQIIGFTSASRVGAYGLEQYYDEILRGRDGKIRAESDALGDETLPFDLPQGSPAIDGSTIVLTLNSAVQNIAERELQKGLTDFGAKSGQIIILEPSSGKILALASYPAPDLNTFATTKMDQFANPAVSLPYEPGSVFKVVTLAAGLDSGKITPGIVMNDPGSVVIGGRRFYNSDRRGYGDVTLTTAMEKSLNVIAAKIALATGPKTFYQYLHDFGFGALSNVDLAGEIPGTVKNPGDGIWYESDLGTNSFGQGIATTPLQMTNALAVVANGGNLMRPYIVDRIIYPDGSVEVRQPRVIRRVLKTETAKEVVEILSHSIAKESTNKASLPGYKIAGKTGTAQIPIPGGYDPKWTIASFGGFLPADNPQYVILVKIDRPSKSPWGSQVASPVFASVAQQLAQLTGLPPDDVRTAQK